MDNRGIYRGAGLSMILGAILLFISYLLVILGVGTVGLPKVVRASYVLALHKVSLIKIGVNLLPLALLLILIGIAGGLVWLWDRSRGLGFAGAIVGLLGIFALFDFSLIEIGIVRIASGLEPSLSNLTIRTTFILLTIEKLLLVPGIFLIALFFFLWGLAFFEVEGGKITGSLSLLEVLAFIVAILLFILGRRTAAGFGFLVNAVIGTLALLSMGTLFLREE